MTRVISVPQGQYHQKLTERFGSDALITRLAIGNWFTLLSMDYRSETPKMLQLDGYTGCVFMVPTARSEYQVIMPIGVDFRASFSAFDFGLLATLLAYRELKSLRSAFKKDFDMLVTFLSDCEVHTETTQARRLVLSALEQSLSPAPLLDPTDASSVTRAG